MTWIVGEWVIQTLQLVELLTVVPLFRPVRSRVVPAGTATEERTIVEQEVLDLMAEAAPLEPVKVQVEERCSISDARVAAGAACTAAAPSRPIIPSLRPTTMMERMNDNW